MATQTIVNKDAETRPIIQNKQYPAALQRKNFTKRANAINSEAMLWHPAWRDIKTYLLPTRGFFSESTPNQGQKIDHKTLVDGHGTLAIDIMANGLLSGLSSKSRPWFKLGLDDFDLMEYHPVKVWLDDVTNRMYAILANSNCYAGLHAIYKELAGFGTAACFMEEDFDKMIRLRPYTAGEYALSTDDKGRVNVFYRKFWMKVGQLVKEFGLENVSPEAQSAYNSNTPDKWVSVNLLIEPNDDRIPYLKDYENMAYRVIYYEDSANENHSYLRLGGREEFPVLAPRWEVTSTTDIYGRGPGWHALGDIKMLQQLQKEKFMALAKVANPPLQRDASVVGEVMNMPGGITAFSATLPNAGLKPAYQVNPDLNAIRQDINETKEAINRYFFVNLFIMFMEAARQGRNVTATEIVEKQSEKLSMLGPVIDRTEEEVHVPLITWLYNHMKSNFLLPEAPPEIEDMNINIQFISILAQAQKLMNISGVDQWSAGVMQDAAADPNVIDLINLDAKNRIKASMLGVPAKILRSEEEVANLRNARAKKQQQIDQQAAMASAAETADKGASAVKKISEAQLGAGSALDALSARMSGGPA